MIKFSPSVLTADFTRLGEVIRELDRIGSDMLHLDVMDGIFVPNISFGMPVVKSIRSITDNILDVHLMIDRPHRYIEQFAQAGADIIGIHAEAGSDIADTLRAIRALGKKSCLTIKPKTPAEEIFPYLELCDMVLVMSVEPGFGGQRFMGSALPKITLLSQRARALGLPLEIEVDGGVNLQTAPLCAAAGADVLVAGNVLFSAPDMAQRLSELRSACEA